VTRWLPFLVPPLYLVVVLTVAPADRLGGPDRLPWLDRLLYDDYDVAAMTLRALNAEAGRAPGRLDPPPTRGSQALAASLRRSPLLEPRYFLEWPHAALLLFRVMTRLADGTDQVVPHAVADASYNDIVEYQPRDEEERALWRRFRRTFRWHAVVMTACLLGLMALARTGYEANGRLAASAWWFVLPAVLYFSINRFDVVPALLTAASLACLGRDRLPASAALLALATLVKVYPVLLAPLVWRWLSDRPRRAFAWAAVYAGTTGGFLVTAVLLADTTAVFAPYRYQLGRAAEFGWTLYGYLLPASLAGNDLPWSLLRPGAAFLVLVLCVWRRPVDLAEVLRRGVVVLAVFVGLQTFFSPQWILWLWPMAAPLAMRRAWLAGLLLALDVTTYLSFPVTYDGWLEGATEVARPALILARSGLLIGLVAWAALAPRPSGTTAAT
jgi:hypothetical protein